MSLSTLPEVVLRKLFSYFPLQTLIHCGRVCKSWATLRATELSKRRTATLYIAKSHYPHELFSPHKLAHFDIPYLHEIANQSPLYMSTVVCKNTRNNFNNMETVKRMYNTLRAISHLQCIYAAGHFQDIAYKLCWLIAHKSSELLDLKIFATNDDLPFKQTTQMRSHDFCDVLLDTINTYATKLRHLTLYTAHQLCPCSNQCPTGRDCFWYSKIKAPLDEITFVFKESLLNAQQFGKIAYHRYNDDDKDDPDDLKCEGKLRIFRDIPNSRFIRKYERIFGYDHVTHLNRIRANVQMELNFALKCTRLECLDLLFLKNSSPAENCHLSLPKLAQQLQPLTNLIYLELTVNFKHQIPLIYFDNTHHQPPPQLKSIQILKINLENSQHHTDLDSQLWSSIFPSIQVLILSGMQFRVEEKCSNCAIHRQCRFSEERCFDQLILNWAHCPKLRLIYHGEQKCKVDFRNLNTN